MWFSSVRLLWNVNIQMLKNHPFNYKIIYEKTYDIHTHTQKNANLFIEPCANLSYVPLLIIQKLKQMYRNFNIYFRHIQLEIIFHQNILRASLRSCELEKLTFHFNLPIKFTLRRYFSRSAPFVGLIASHKPGRPLHKALCISLKIRGEKNYRFDTIGCTVHKICSFGIACWIDIVDIMKKRIELRINVFCRCKYSLIRWWHAA